MAFLDDDYLLETDAALDLYDHIADRPIVDPHNHIDLDDILANDTWDDIWAVEGATDHYIWQLMRKRGVPEAKITGDATNREKWNALAETLPMMAGNPTYEWLHLDLKRRFGIDKEVTPETADEIWEETKAQLQTDDMRPQAVLREMDVEIICSTDDPTSRLQAHERFAEEVEDVELHPTFRPDRGMKIDNAEWSTFVEELDAVTESDVSTFDGFLSAFEEQHHYFREHGCKACDIGTGTNPHSKPVSEERAAEIYDAARRGENLDPAAVEDFWAFMLEFIGELNAEAGWVTQLHVGAVRNYRESLFDEVGINAGGDVATQDVDIVEDIDYFLDAFDGEMEIVLYTLDPTHYPSATVVARAYPNLSIGPAWWFHDSPMGIEEQLEEVASIDLLANHAGMVSDSRKVVSYDSRFEVFRRSLANVVGRMVDRGQLSMERGKDLVDHLAYDRPKELYGF
ncbi:glucuronate isomerase [Halorhabdus sp. BNX81]|uniref:glucuronate isomerase n=1 Tax=Halorhabdus sp. BNX81 TaxID=2980181 RepID=UPI0023DD5FC1|nr:glucuronate isomerase [Halorhabdus sp. BNX81]WEL20810.1 Glucuronate isomerase [Halorhabdus sp. BNX81]